ncbi:putative sodium bile acid cotransporter, sodium/solute symporter superfamily [Helianthus annuus]|nr:putative sodium bile acid cotransporter, sodium/solute symporter superfamily [Helianthus annuus]
MLDLLIINQLVAALIGGVAFALINPSPGCFAHRYQVSKFSIIGIFLISGLTLRSAEVGEAAEAWPVGLFGLLAGGNPALALAMTVISSLLGILIVPFSISRLIAGGVGASVPADEMFRSLIGTVLIPLILGKVTRYLSCLTCSDHLSCHKPHKFNSYFSFNRFFGNLLKVIFLLYILSRFINCLMFR